MYAPGGTFTRSFPTQTVGGNKQNADSLPIALLRHNGVNDGAVTLTVTNRGTGDYTASGTIPSTYNFSDDVEVIVSATVGGIVGELVIVLGPLGGSSLDIEVDATTING